MTEGAGGALRTSTVNMQMMKTPHSPCQQEKRVGKTLGQCGKRSDDKNNVASLGSGAQRTGFGNSREGRGTFGGSSMDTLRFLAFSSLECPEFALFSEKHATLEFQTKVCQQGL